ncbi:MAG: hypothetical protein EKK35_18595 [Bradyrhizobiaceae bacterium]|uniref:hypothetical protein n=1 Tax=unclassified Afipia TaxID=2642050 RepID=UPI0004669983|nr:MULTISPECIES: hypothetical protein [unclassified Afipia]MAH71462.1 hypothetical protein [Afipia sp.]OUX59495.1 MAG: hypothetical protein CBB64_19745 [Afipia sp. TMED4]RTL77044.1 MAG: hypothetical protein EKK35_18595 [Bradyrhizobiaceae bacterium]HAO41736.1 hypothetical protein [Afipia sp.]HAP10668.1 hypothetical protein [Afipia sp.]
MVLIRLLALSIVVTFFTGVPDTARAADAWGCNYDKCVAYCTKVSGKNCTIYCERRLQDKRRDKVCK